MTPLRIVSVDDHPVVREGLRWMLEADDEVKIVGEADNLTAAFTTIRTLEPDVVLLDIDLAGSSSLDSIHDLRAEFPEVAVIMLTMSVDPVDVETAVRAGACGYLVKNASRGEFIRAIRAAAGGKAYIQAEVTRPLLQSLARQARRASSSMPDLSNREHQVVSLAASGLANKQIASRLGISEPTVKEYLHQVFEKLGASDRAQAVAIALRNQLIE